MRPKCSLSCTLPDHLPLLLLSLLKREGRSGCDTAAANLLFYLSHNVSALAIHNPTCWLAGTAGSLDTIHAMMGIAPMDKWLLLNCTYTRASGYVIFQLPLADGMLLCTAGASKLKRLYPWTKSLEGQF